MDALKNLWYNILTVFFGIFSQVMVKAQPIWDKFKIPISITLGLILGLIIGWVLFPVEWENATPANLRRGFPRLLSRLRCPGIRDDARC